MSTIDTADLQRLAEAIKDVAAPATPNVNAASIKLPEFWTEDPELWFARAEAQFATRDIKSGDTKFNYVVAALDNSTAAEVKHILVSPPANKYEALRKALMEAFAKSQAQKDAELLAISGLGDRRPTALLRKIQSLNSDPDTLLRAFFLAQLPSDVRAVLAAMDSTNIEDLAKAADRVIESKSLAPHGSIHEVYNVSAVHDRAPYKPRQSAYATPVSSSSSNICYFHNKFGTKARRCRPGCLFADLCPSSDPSTKPCSQATRSGNDNAGR